MDGKYVLIKDCLSTDMCTELAEALKVSPHFKYDAQCDKSRSFRDFPPCNILLGKMTDLFSDVTKVKLKPTYSYARIYFKGSELMKHTDRPSCEYSVTINLSQSHPWPIYMDGTPLDLSPGDAVIYMGCDVEHYRDVFEGDEYIQVFLHYVDANGPYKDHVFDTKNMATPEESFKIIEFEGINPGIVNYYVFKDAFSNDELQYIIDQVSDDKLEFAGIGSGKVDQVLRSTKVFWLPRTEQFKHVYYKIADMAVDANMNAYHFKIKAFREKIQYTVYKDDYNGHYSWHLDIGAKYTNRKLSIIVQMSDPSEYEGGEVQLWVDRAEPVTLEKDKGAVIIFPSYLLHRVTPVTKGTRRSLVTWIDGPVFR
jgi:PKHD-type hydroxylase